MRFLLSLLLLPMASGCVTKTRYSSDFKSTAFATTGSPWSDDQKMSFRHSIRDNSAALESARVVLIFDDVTAKEIRSFPLRAKEQVIQVAGPGESSSQATWAVNRHSLAFRSDYVNGTNTVRFGKQTLRFIEGGTILLVGDQSVDLSAGRKVVYLKAGKVTVH